MLRERGVELGLGKIIRVNGEVGSHAEWPDFGLTMLSNDERQREPVRAILAGQAADAQVNGACVTVYGTDAPGRIEPITGRAVRSVHSPACVELGYAVG